MRTHCPDGVQLKVFPIYIALVNGNGGFQKHQRKSTFFEPPKNFIVRMGGWVGGDILGPLIFLKIAYYNKQDVLIPNMASKA